MIFSNLYSPRPIDLLLVIFLLITLKISVLLSTHYVFLTAIYRQIVSIIILK